MEALCPYLIMSSFVKFDTVDVPVFKDPFILVSRSLIVILPSLLD